MLDTRLKNNKKALHTAVAIVALAAVCFAIISINCKDKVNDYYLQVGSDFEGEAFIKTLFQCNYVLYPAALEKSGKNVRPEDLYLSFEEKTIPEVLIDQYVGNEIAYEGNSEQIRVERVAEVQNNLLRNDSMYVTELGMKLDYCVIDEDTQTILKNTGREIELLKNGEGYAYAYYLIIRYDQNGVISDISVSGSNAEQFIKNVQLVANSTDSLLLDDKQKTMDYVLVSDSGRINSKMTVTQKNPQNVTFIYAMTVDQMEDFTWFPIYRNGDMITANQYIHGENRELMYDMIGVGRIYLTFLAVITGVFFILARRMPQRTADTAGTKYCAELIFAVLWILAIVFYSAVVQLVYYVNEVFPAVNLVKFYVLSGTMFLLFGAWYWCLLSIRDLFNGLRPFFSKRSWMKAHYIKWKKELASVDLEKDIVRRLKKLVILQFLMVSISCCFWYFGIFIMVIYSILFYYGWKRYMGKVQGHYRNLMEATNAIAQGKFDSTFEGDFGIFESYKNELYQIQGGFRTAVEEEVKSQRMKTELITNVSHDLKTPLTAIITYIDLLKEENVTDEQRKSYLETLERKSLRLKVLIEDLFEISKASSGNVKLEPVAVDICNLMRQVYLEHEDKMKACGLDMRFDLPEEKVILQLDSQKTYRIFENLYVNITKYAMPNTRVYVQAKVSITDEGQKNIDGKIVDEKTADKKIHIELKNISAQELTVNPMDLTERFVRGDVSRNTEGSGLGLAIAKSFIELQGGRFGIEIDGDLFKVVIEWNVK